MFLRVLLQNQRTNHRLRVHAMRLQSHRMIIVLRAHLRALLTAHQVRALLTIRLRVRRMIQARLVQAQASTNLKYDCI